MEDKITTIRCLESTIKKLREFEVHPRETNEDIILRLIKEVRKNDIKADNRKI